jgi:DNA-binding MarR family transcriptional regulator
MLDADNKSVAARLADITSRLFFNCQEKEIRCVAEYGVSTVEFRCLRFLHDNDQLTVNQLAQLMALTSSRITRIIDGLVTKKLVKRESGQSDRRTYNLSLTSKGQKLSIAMINDHTKMHQEILQSIPSEDHYSMLENLDHLNNAVEKWLKNK